ncbi:MAG: glutamine-hydrolyzing GMP synthase [Candidatus Odinarchaeia archaeon]
MSENTDEVNTSKTIKAIMDSYILNDKTIEVAILDFGGQYTHLIKRILDEVGAQVEILPYSVTVEQLERLGTKAVVLGGGPNSVYAENAPRCNLDILTNKRLKILGICYGHQLIAQQFDGKVIKSDVGEYGLVNLYIDDPNDPLFKDIPPVSTAWASHTDTVAAPPLGGKVIAHTDNCQIAAYNVKNRIWGVQFHPEVSQTEYGSKMFENFVFNIAKCTRIQ